MAFISQSARQTLAWLLYLAALLCARSVLAFDAPHIAASQVLQGPDALDHTSFASAANTAGKPEEATAVLASTWGLGTSLLFAELAGELQLGTAEQYHRPCCCTTQLFSSTAPMQRLM